MTRTTLWLYLEDVEAMERAYGRGWSGYAREIIHRYMRERKERTDEYNRRADGP